MDIVENAKQHLPAFIRLNEAWIAEHFEIEEADRQLAENPYKIIESGGYTFSLISANEVLGVCALFNDGDGVYELARMAVSPGVQGKGYGSQLINHALLKLRSINARKVYLISNTKLSAAIGLYTKHGFYTVSEGPHPAYARANIVMQRTDF